MSKFKKIAVAVAASTALSCGGVVAVANADDVENIGPATDTHNRFWSFIDSVMGGSSSSKSEQSGKGHEDNSPKESKKSDEEKVVAAPSVASGEFVSVKDPAAIGNFWDNLNTIEAVQKLPDTKIAKYSRKDWNHWELIGTEATADEWPDNVPRSCDARRATLVRDGENLEVSNKCKIHVKENGGWTDHYGVPVEDEETGDVVVDDEGYIMMYEALHDTKPTDFDIDHIVALEDAHVSGGYAWNEKQRQTLANDPLNLAISDKTANRSKGSKPLAEYTPVGDFRCEYVQRYVAVKAKYHLKTTVEDKAVAETIGRECGL